MYLNRKIKDGVYTVRKAVGFVEIKSIPVGIQTADEMVKADYGLPFTAGFNKDNIFGVQFHPEKSHKFGMRILERFAKI